jgi:hypothetical protein
MHLKSFITSGAGQGPQFDQSVPLQVVQGGVYDVEETEVPFQRSTPGVSLIKRFYLRQ